MLLLDGAPAEWIDGFRGGDVTADVVTERAGAGCTARKHIASLRTPPITLAVGAGMSAAFHDRVGGALDGTAADPRRSGALVVVDAAGRERYRLDFRFALPTALEVPALDAGSEAAVSLTVELTPELTRTLTDDAGRVVAAPPRRDTRLRAGRFRLRADGLDAPLAQVSGIAPFALRPKPVEDAVGELRDFEVEARRLEPGNLTFALPASRALAGPVRDWFQRFAIAGDARDDQEKVVTLGRAPLFTFSFAGVDIFALSPGPVGRVGGDPPGATASLYAEEASFEASCP